MKTTIAIILIVLLSVSANAQQSSRLEGRFIFSGSQGLGSENPWLGGGVRSLSRSGRFGLDAKLDVLRAPKIQTHNGIVIQGQALVRYYFRPTFYAGGGLRLLYQATSVYSKHDASAAGMFGYQRGLVNLETGFESGFQSENRLRVFRGSFEAPVIRRGKCFAMVGAEASTTGFHNLAGESRRGSRFGVSVSAGCFVKGGE